MTAVLAFSIEVDSIMMQIIKKVRQRAQTDPDRHRYLPFSYGKKTYNKLPEEEKPPDGGAKPPAARAENNV